MTAYIIRRLLLMIPTLIGITLLVFVIVASAGGGVGAALAFAGGAAEGGMNRAAQEAYLESRYGLDDPVLVQYARWLHRVSPVKFGARQQRDPTGRAVSPPRPPRPPMLVGEWFGERADLATPGSPEAAELPEDADGRHAQWLTAKNDYHRALSDSIGARTALELALTAYAREHLPSALDADEELDEAALAAHTPAEGSPLTAEVIGRGYEAIDAYNTVVERLDRLRAVFAAKPYPEVGVPIIPGVLSLGPPDLGYSYSRSQTVGTLIGRALPVTLLLNAVAVPIIYIVAIPMGMLAAIKQGRLFDTLSGALFVALWSIPVVWAGVLAVGYLANDRYLGWFPVAGLHDARADDFTFLPTVIAGEWQRGYLLDTLWHMALPVACLIYAGFAVLSKQTRAAMLDNFNADYVRTAKAKGVAEGTIVLRHVFRNSLLPLITMFATVFPAMLAGSVVVEQIFAVPGMGRLVIEAINLRDREVILANTLIIAIVNVFALLLADLLYAIADPRISYE